MDDHDALFLHVADALDFAINFFRRSHATARRIYMNDDGFDGIVIAELLELSDDSFGIQDDAFQTRPRRSCLRSVVSDACSPPACNVR